MASSMISAPAFTTVNRASPAQANMVAPFSGLKSLGGFPVTRKTNDITSVANNGGRVQCMQVWPPLGKKKFETLSYLPDLNEEQLRKEVDYLLRKGWVPCLEFEVGVSYTDSRTVRTTGHRDTMTEGTGQCGSFPCLDAPTQVRSSRNFRRLRLHTPRHSSVLSDSTTFAKCSASASSLTSQRATKSYKTNESFVDLSFVGGFVLNRL
ncbi:ribulose bisphosphate carboxylase small subunit, chloroplastic isoform X2 [Arachis duranensis]|uniref:Ribulose bisphosphate carboxylase small subunit n=1 Tax=Arachis duranensis TaxID=130453 RepID=A0A9C6TIP6_ARADU|nr:ribulose bisphosphate carboxylase small subunit, chloroplastic isoform X2 [Arachis duranensis]